MADWNAQCGPKSIGIYKSDLSPPPEGLVTLAQVDDTNNKLSVYTENPSLAGEHEIVYIILFKFYPAIYKVSSVIKITVLESCKDAVISKSLIPIQ